MRSHSRKWPWRDWQSLYRVGCEVLIYLCRCVGHECDLLLDWYSKTEGNTYATLLHHPFLFKGKPTHAKEVAGPYGPYLPPGGSGNPPGTLIRTRYIPKHFSCPNTIVQYINLCLSTISRLLVMSVISSGTLNNNRSPNHITQMILYHHRTLCVRTIRVWELCRHDRYTYPVNKK